MGKRKAVFYVYSRQVFLLCLHLPYSDLNCVMVVVTVAVCVCVCV